MKHILLFGAGKSATVLIDYLKQVATGKQWRVTIADVDLAAVEAKVGVHALVKAVGISIEDENARKALIQQADVVISLLPAALHYIVALDCLAFGKHLLTASYVDDKIKVLADKIKQKNILFLCEMGLDPGIDHMSAMELIHRLREQGARFTGFRSHTGGLVAPESDDNPWHYKISWNPRNVVLAGKAGAIYKTGGNIVKEEYAELFETGRGMQINEEIGFLSYYPNRDSLSYIDTYGLHDADTFMRTTLRYPDFMYGWNNIIELNLTDETPQYDTDGMSIAAFFKLHFDTVNFSEWVHKKLEERLSFVKDLTEKMNKLMEAENEHAEAHEHDKNKTIDEFSIVDEEGNLQQINVDEMKSNAAYAIAHKMHEANQTLKQLFYLGMDDDETIINKGKCSAADVLQFCLEKKLALQPEDKDMIVMLHEFECLVENKQTAIKSSLIVKGENSLRTAMAKTVGLPLGIAAKLILNGTINLTGLHIPTAKEIYIPVLKELEKNGIVFKEEIF